MPTQLISNVMNTQVHTHTHNILIILTGVSLNSGRATPQNVFDVVENMFKMI